MCIDMNYDELLRILKISQKNILINETLCISSDILKCSHPDSYN